MVTECLGSLASYWQKMKHREPEFLHQPSVQLCFALCSTGHWLKPLLRQEGKGSEVMGQWRSGSSGACQPLSCSLLSASWAVPMSFWAKQWHNFIPGRFFSPQPTLLCCNFNSQLCSHDTHMLFTLVTNRRSVCGLLNIPSSALIFWLSAANLIPGYAQMEELPPATAWADPRILLCVLLHSQSITTALILKAHKSCIYKESFLGDGSLHDPEDVELLLGCCWRSHPSWITDY